MTIDADRAADFFAASDRLHGRHRGGVRDPRRRDARPRRRASRSCATRRRPTTRCCRESIAGELISQRDRDPLRPRRGPRRRARAPARRAPAGCSRSPASRGIALGATGTHPWADYREQHNIDTEHYRRVVDGLQYVARRNNTFSLHVHVGVRGRRPRGPRLRPAAPGAAAAAGDQRQLAVPRRRATRGLHSARTQTFTKSFPRCGIPDAFGSLGGLPRLHRLPRSRTNSIVEYTQVWWSIRPHFASGPSRCGSATRRSTAAGVRGAGGADRRLRRPGRARHRRGRAVRRSAARG